MKMNAILMERINDAKEKAFIEGQKEEKRQIAIRMVDGLWL